MFSKLVFLSSFFALALAQAPPTCYSAGFGPASTCSQLIATFCRDVAKDEFRVGDSGSRCFNLPNGNRCDFIALNTRNINAAPSLANCRTVLDNITRRCPSGGFGRISSGALYTFTVDPNVGRCTQDVQPGS